jgi:hypothetical protein
MALPEEMNYTQHIDALGVKKDRIGLAPNNGSSFICNTGYLNFEVPCQQFSKFADFTNAYIAFDITNSDEVTNTLYGQLGTIALQNKLTVETTSNRKFSEVDNVNALWDIKLSQSVDPDWYKSNGSMMFGTGETPNLGVDIGADATAHYIMPIGMSGLCDNTYVPLIGRENLRFRIDLEQAKTAVYCSDANVADSEITLTNVVLYYDVMTLADDQMKSLLNAIGGKFIMSGVDYYHQNQQIALASTSANISIGCSRRKAKKLIGCFRTVGKMTTANANSFSRNKANLTEITVKLNGTKVNQADLPLNATTAPEAYAEIMKCSQGGLLNLHSTSLGEYKKVTGVSDTGNTITYTYYDMFNLDEGDATVDETTGRFFFEVDLSSGMDTKDSVGGLNVMTGNFNLEFQKAATMADQYLDIWIEYHSEYVLDMQAGGTWQIYN